MNQKDKIISEYFSNISKMRKNKVGGFADKEKARLAQIKSVESRKQNAKNIRIETGTLNKIEYTDNKRWKLEKSPYYYSIFGRVRSPPPKTDDIRI
jgi:hypothetical protein